MGWLVAAALIAGMAVGSGPVTLLATFVGLGTAVVWPMAGLVVLAFTAPLVPPSVIPSPGFDTALVAALVFGCVLRLPVERPRFAPVAPLVLVVAFVTYVFAQQFPDMLRGWGDEVALSAGYHFIEIATGAGAIIAAGLILRDRSPMPILAAVVGTAIFAALLAIASGGEPESAPGIIRNLLGESDQEGRAMGPFVNPNYFGTYMAMALVLVAGLIASRSTEGMSYGLLAGALVLGVGLALSMSRGAIATLLAGLTAIAFVRSPKVGSTVAVTGLVFVMLAYPLFLEWRLANENEGIVSTAVYMNQANSDDSRFGVLATVPAVFERSPVFGVGPGQFARLSAEVTPGGVRIETHNWYLQVLAEQGVVGASIWLALLAAIAIKMMPRPTSARIVGFGMLAAIAVASVFLQPPGSYQFSALPLLVLTASLVADWPSPRASIVATAQTVAAEFPRPAPLVRRAAR